MSSLKSIRHSATESGLSSTSCAPSGAATRVKNLLAKMVSRRDRKSSLASLTPICSFSSAIILLIDGSSLNRAIDVMGSLSKYQATVPSCSSALSTKLISIPGASKDKFNSARRTPEEMPWVRECRKMVRPTQVEKGGFPAANHSLS